MSTSCGEPFCGDGHHCDGACCGRREEGWWLFEGVLFFIRKVKDIAIDQEISL